MRINIKEIIDYYARVQPSLKDIYRETVRPGFKVNGTRTNPSGSGLVIPLAGKACYTVDGASYELKPGFILHAGALMNLTKEVVGDQSWHFILLHYKIPREESSNFPCYDAHFSIETGVCARISSCAKQLHANEQNSGGLTALHTRTLFARLLEEILLSAQRRTQDDEGTIANDAVAFLDKHYTENVNIGQLADLYDMDIKHFSYLFSKHTGLSALGYLIALRMRHAKDLFRTRVYTVAQVAETVGYNDSYYFSRLFKKHTGMSPSEFMTGSIKPPEGSP
ncbi:MAG: AraC family transcriptional regulator [Treponema sp.]|jgi:AraC-like DNA-binding protein|nr:AraC family transcriptional regulator [Treponema sp.]